MAATPASLAVSPEAEEVRALVRLPLTQRKPVGYDPELLKTYRPNRTHYLPAAMRKHLSQIGVSRCQGPAGGNSCALREIAVGIDGSVFHPIEGPQRIEEMFDLFLKKAQAIQDPFEHAFFSMVHLPYLQPFEDVNKRV